MRVMDEIEVQVCWTQQLICSGGREHSGIGATIDEKRECSERFRDLYPYRHVRARC